MEKSQSKQFYQFPLTLSQSPYKTRLDINEKGEVKIRGDVTPEIFQTILDASHLKSLAYQKHQEKLDKEANLMTIYIGVIFASVLGLVVFSFCNLKPQSQQSYNHAQSIIS